VVRRHHTSETETGAPLIPLLRLIGECPSREGATASRFMPSHGLAAVVRRSFRRARTFTPGDWGSGSLAFTLSAGSNVTGRTASSDRRAFLPACYCPVGLSTAGKLVAQTPPSSVSRLHRGCDDAPHGAHRACHFHGTRLKPAPSGSRPRMLPLARYSGLVTVLRPHRPYAESTIVAIRLRCSPDPRQRLFRPGMTPTTGLSLSARLWIPVAFRRAAFASWVILSRWSIPCSLRFTYYSRRHQRGCHVPLL
jgi:hypothetical protein